MQARITYDVARIREDMALRGWMQQDRARSAGVTAQTVTNFLSGHPQTAKTAHKLALALGYTVRRYLISNRKVA
jgi:transcriptional regulator with XRE-family HTH domain